MSEFAATNEEDLYQPTTDDRYIVLKQWWERHCKGFSEWYLTKLDEKTREVLLLTASPDMPREIAATREIGGLEIKATDVLLPELTLQGLNAEDGKLLCLFFTRRCVEPDLCFHADVTFLNGLRKKGTLPSFSNGTLEGMDTPFVDPVDPEENVRSLTQLSSATARKQVETLIEEGRLIHAEVYLALQVRRAAIVAFLVTLAEAHEKAVIGELSPTYAALLDGEIAQQKALIEEEIAEASGAVAAVAITDSTGSAATATATATAGN